MNISIQNQTVNFIKKNHKTIHFEIIKLRFKNKHDIIQNSEAQKQKNI